MFLSSATTILQLSTALTLQGDPTAVAAAETPTGIWHVEVADAAPPGDTEADPDAHAHGPGEHIRYFIEDEHGNRREVDVHNLPPQALAKVPPFARVRVRIAPDTTADSLTAVAIDPVTNDPLQGDQQTAATSIKFVTGSEPIGGGQNGGGQNGGGQNGGGQNGGGPGTPFPGNAPNQVPCEFPGQVPSNNPGNVPSQVPPQGPVACQAGEPRKIALIQLEVARNGTVISNPWSANFVQQHIIDQGLVYLERIFGHMVEFTFDRNEDGLEDYTDVFGPVVVQDTTGNCLSQWYTWTQDAMAQLEASGALGLDSQGNGKQFCDYGPNHPNASANAPECVFFDHIASMTPYSIGCSGFAFQGVATYGPGLKDEDRRATYMMLRKANTGVAGYQPRAVFTHELGHTLGLGHAGVSADYNPIPWSGNPAWLYYGDLSASMGYNFGLYNAPHANKLGVFSDGTLGANASWPWKWQVAEADSVFAPQFTLTALHAASSPGVQPATPLAFDSSDGAMTFAVEDAYGRPTFVSYVADVDPNLPTPFFDVNDPMDLTAPYRSYNRSIVVHRDGGYQSWMIEKINLPDPATATFPIQVQLQSMNLSFQIDGISNEALSISQFDYN